MKNALVGSGKKTHISRMSNSVTHLQSYTNTAIANIARNSTPGADIAVLNAGSAASSADVTASGANVVASNCECFMMFHNVL